MCHPGFASEFSVELFYRTFVDYFKKLNIDNKTDGFTIEYLCAEAYHDIFQLNDFDDPYKVMPVIEYTNADTLGDLGPKAELINEYRNNDILGRYGLSIKEYMELPVDICVLLLSRARTETQDEQEIQKAAMREAEREANKN